MAEVIRYVDPNSVTTGNGTTNALTGPNAAYISLVAWEAAEDGDLAGAGDSHIVYCSSSGGAADTGELTINGWTTTSAFNITISQATSDRHGGKWDDSAYRLIVSTTSPAITCDEAGVTTHINFDGLQIQQTNGGDNDIGLAIKYGTWITTVENCIFKGTNGAGGYADGIQIYQSDAATTVTIRNCLFYDFDSASNDSGVYVEDATVTIDNCTAVDCSRGFWKDGTATVTITNCVTRGCDANNGYVGTYETASDYNSSDSSGDAPNTGGSGNDNTASPWYSGATSDAAIFNDSSTFDYSHKTGSIFINIADDLSGSFTTDIADVTRSSWDLGAFEYVAPAPFSGVALSISSTGVYTADSWSADLSGSDPPMRIDPDGSVHVHSVSAIGAAGSYGLFPIPSAGEYDDVFYASAQSGTWQNNWESANRVYAGDAIDTTASIVVGRIGAYVYYIGSGMTGLSAGIWTDSSNNLGTLISGTTAQPITSYPGSGGMYYWDFPGSGVTLSAGVWNLTLARPDLSYHSSNAGQLSFATGDWSTAEDSWARTWNAAGTNTNNWNSSPWYFEIWTRSATGTSSGYTLVVNSSATF